MHLSIVKKKLKAKEPVLAAKVNFMSPQVVELLGMMGFDCLWICNEHLYADQRLLDHLTLACRASGMDTMLRRNIAGYHDLLQPLEMGVHGFMIPRVRSIEYLKKIVDDVKFPPQGKRGLDGVNADANYGLMPVQDYMHFSNSQTFIVAQIEDVEAIPLIDQVAAVEGVDVVFIGQGDMSVSMGMAGQVRHPRILEVVDQVANSCARHGKTAGVPALNADDATAMIEKGFGFFTTGADYRFIKNGLLALRKDFSSIGFKFRDMQLMEEEI